MALTTPSCPLCGQASRYALTATDRNRETTCERFVYNRCLACGTTFMVEVPADLSQYYAGDYHQFTRNGEPAWRTNKALLDAEAFRVRLLQRHVKPGRLIDIGAGPGAFTAAARAGGFDVTAIEMDERCCRYIEDSLGVRAICSDRPIEELERLPDADAITLWHVLEHLRDPAGTMAAAAAKLRPGGVLAIGVPNPHSLQFRVLGKRWPHLDAPRHLCLMPATALVTQGVKLGLKQAELTTCDPLGKICDVHGWAYAMRRRPAQGPASPRVGRTAGLLSRLLDPIEGTGHRGSALTLLLAKAGADTES